MPKFPGLLSNVNPHDLPQRGAVEQINCHSRKSGCLQPRHGFRPIGVTEVGGETASAANVLAMQSLHIGSHKGAIFLNASGEVRLARQPT